jgi:TetR/AcrR family transcriptional regulator, repressor for uid operon
MRKTDTALHERRRDELLQAAEQCFIERGFHRTTIQDIASAANVSLGLLYRYYQNKDAVIIAVANQERDSVISTINTTKDADNFIGALKQMMRKLLKESLHPDYVRLSTELFAEACRNPELAEAFSMSESAMRQALIDVIRYQQKKGAVNTAVDANVSSDILIALIDGLGVRALLNPKFKPRAIEAGLDLVIDSLFSIE